WQSQAVDAARRDESTRIASVNPDRQPRRLIASPVFRDQGRHFPVGWRRNMPDAICFVMAFAGIEEFGDRCRPHPFRLPAKATGCSFVPVTKRKRVYLAALTAASTFS